MKSFIVIDKDFAMVVSAENEEGAIRQFADLFKAEIDDTLQVQLLDGPTIFWGTLKVQTVASHMEERKVRH